MKRLLDALFCAIGVHAWFDAPPDREGRPQRVCATCPAKEKFVLVDIGRTKRWVLVTGGW